MSEPVFVTDEHRAAAKEVRGYLGRIIFEGPIAELETGIAAILARHFPQPKSPQVDRQTEEAIDFLNERRM